MSRDWTPEELSAASAAMKEADPGHTGRKEAHMTIIERSNGLTDRQVFTITHGSGMVNVKDCDGRTFDVVDYILYSDPYRKTGDERELLAIVTNDGDIMCTSSATVISTFKDMREQFALPIENVQIVSGQSKNGRTYYDLVLA